MDTDVLSLAQLLLLPPLFDVGVSSSLAAALSECIVRPRCTRRRSFVDACRLCWRPICCWPLPRPPLPGPADRRLSAPRMAILLVCLHLFRATCVRRMLSGLIKVSFTASPAPYALPHDFHFSMRKRLA